MLFASTSGIMLWGGLYLRDDRCAHSFHIAARVMLTSPAISQPAERSAGFLRFSSGPMCPGTLDIGPSAGAEFRRQTVTDAK